MKQRFSCLRAVIEGYRQARRGPGTGKQFFGHFADYAHLPPVRDILNDDTDGATLKSIKAKLVKVLPALMNNVEEKNINDFKAFVRTCLGNALAARADEPQTLAISAFRCTKCNRQTHHEMYWPAILAHKCMARHAVDSEDPYEHRAFEWEQQTYRKQPLVYLPGPKQLALLAIADLASTRSIVATCGLDPDTATPAVLDACEVRLRCLLCAQVAKQQIFDWRSAVRSILAIAIALEADF